MDDRTVVAGVLPHSRAASRWAGRALLLSGGGQVVGVVCLLAMYAGFAIGQESFALTAGGINDTLAIVTYSLLVPAILVLRPMLREALGLAGDAVTLVGLGATAAIVVLQLLLVIGVLGFEQQIGPVAIGFLVLGGWFVAAGAVGRPRGLPIGPWLGVAAGLYFGYPVWAIRLGRYFAHDRG
jgi:hypothetical protein